MSCRRHIAVVLAACLLAHAFALPANTARWRRDDFDNELGDSFDKKSDSTTSSTTSSMTVDPFADDDDDDDFSESMQSSPTTGGSNIFSLLRLAGALFPGSSNSNSFLWNMLREIMNYNQGYFLLRRQDTDANTIEIDYVKGLKPPPPPFQRQESAENDSSESDEDSGSDNDDEDSAGEESVENDKNGDNESSDNASNSSDDYDEPPEGDGQGGGVLGILAGLSGGEDGQSDLGDLLATISGIVGNLSGDGIDLNALIASGLGLFVGLLSEGEENPGTVIGSYLLTSLDSITGGGAKNNGAFFGNLVSKLVKGTSAAEQPEGDSDENDSNAGQMSDSTGFFASLLMSLLGDMSKTSSSGSSQPSRRNDRTRYLSEDEKKLTPIISY